MPGARLLLLACSIAVAVPTPARAQGPQSGKVKVAVMDIRPLGTDPVRAELLSEVALTEAGAMPGFDAIGRSEIAAMIGFEKQRQAMGCTEDASCLAEIGGALGVDYILIGSLGQIGALVRLDLKLVETRRARVRSRMGVSLQGEHEKLVATTQQAIRDLLAPVSPSAVAAKPPKADAKQPAAAVAASSTPAAASEKSASSEKPEKIEATAGTSRRTWAYVTGGTGLALLAGGAIAGLQAKAALDDAKNATDTSRYDDASAKAKSMAHLADGLFIAGAVGVGVGTYLYFTSRPPAVAVGAAPIPGGMVATIAGGF